MGLTTVQRYCAACDDGGRVKIAIVYYRISRELYNFDLVMKYICKKHREWRFKSYYRPHGNLISFYSHTNWIRFLYQQRNAKPHTDRSTSDPPKLPLTHGGSRPPSNTVFLGPTQLTYPLPQTAARSIATPQVSSILYTMGRPIFTPKIAPSCARAIHTPAYTAHPSTHPTYRPKPDPDPIGHFSTNHRTDRHDRQTHRNRPIAIGS